MEQAEVLFENRKLKITEDSITYKRFFSKAQTVQFSDVSDMTAACVKKAQNNSNLFRGNDYEYDISLFDKQWHQINLNVLQLETADSIYIFLIDKVLPKIMVIFLVFFKDDKEMHLGKISLSYSKGVVRTNNIRKTIAWNKIDLFEYRISAYGIGYARIRFGKEVFEFDFIAGSVRQHYFLLESIKAMIGQEKIFFNDREFFS